MHVSIHWDTENGVKPANKTFDYIDQAFDYIGKVQKLLDDKATPAIVLLHQSNHDDRPTTLYTVDERGVPFMDGEQWLPSDIDNAEYVGIVEFQSNDSEWHDFTIVSTGWHLVFGGVCNTGLLESGSYLIDQCFSIDENLSELLSDLESYYNDGPGCQSDSFQVNDRM